MIRVGDTVRYAGTEYTVRQIIGPMLDWRDGPVPAVAWIQSRSETRRVQLDALE